MSVHADSLMASLPVESKICLVVVSTLKQHSSLAAPGSDNRASVARARAKVHAFILEQVGRAG